MCIYTDQCQHDVALRRVGRCELAIMPAYGTCEEGIIRVLITEHEHGGDDDVGQQREHTERDVCHATEARSNHLQESLVTTTTTQLTTVPGTRPNHCLPCRRDLAVRLSAISR